MVLDHYASPPLLIAAVILILTWLVVQWNRNRQLPPGPWGLPLLGYYPFISTQTHEDFSELAKRYGNVFSFRTAGGALIVVLNGSKTIKDVLINRSEEFIGRPQGNNLVSWLSDGLGITPEEGTMWKEQRRFFLQTAKNFGFGKSETESHILEEIQQMMDDIRKAREKPINIHLPIAHAVSNVVTQILANRKFSKNDPTFKDLLEGISSFASAFSDNRNLLLGTSFDLLAKYSPSMELCFKGKNLIKRIAEQFMNEHIESLDKDNPKDYVDAYLIHREEIRKNGNLNESSFTMERLLANLINLILEGTESVSRTITCLLLEISNHVEIQEKVQKELDAVIGRERMPSWIDKQKLPYFEAVIQELYRMVTPFVVTTQYSNYAETTINGYKIPRRSIIMSNLWSIHQDPTVFPNPKKFDPHRFLNADGKKVKLEGPYPFGLGKRSCIGETLAQVEVFLVLASLLQNFKLLPGDSQETLRLIPRT